MRVADERRWRALLNYHNDIPALEVVCETFIEDLGNTVEKVLREFLGVEGEVTADVDSLCDAWRAALRTEPTS